jgi:hypothetical protein
MPRDPQSRDELHRRLAESIGPEAAATLMEALPPHPWDELASRSDVGELRRDFERLDTKIDRVEERFTARLETTEHKLMAAFRLELASSTRAIIFSQIGVVLSTGTLVIAAARLL